MPCGVLADRFSRRAALVAAGLLQAAGHLLWALVPGAAGFAAGFVVWAVGGALVSGAFEALLHDGLAAGGAAGQFGRVYGWVTALDLLTQVPTALAAAALLSLGGFPLVTGASVGACLAAALLAARLPEAPRGAEPDDDERGWRELVRAGVTEAARRPAVRTAVLLVVLLGGLDAVEEYLPLLARDWGVPDAVNPLAGAAGAALGGRAAGWPRSASALALASAGITFAVAAALAAPAGLALLAAGYALYRLVLVVAEARLQAVITGPARATVTSVAGVGIELSALVVFAAYAAGGLALLAGGVVLLAAALPRLAGPTPRT